MKSALGRVNGSGYVLSLITNFFLFNVCLYLSPASLSTGVSSLYDANALKNNEKF